MEVPILLVTNLLVDVRVTDCNLKFLGKMTLHKTCVPTYVHIVPTYIQQKRPPSKTVKMSTNLMGVHVEQIHML